MARVRIDHIITGLSPEGAQMMLYKLLSGMDRRIFETRVISLTNAGLVGNKLQDSLKIQVQALGMRRGIPQLQGIFRLAKLLQERRPNLVQTWMYHADFVGSLACWLSGNIPVVWNIRHSHLDPAYDKRTTIWTAKTCARISRWVPSRIICCSESSQKVHVSLGYDFNKMLVIPNGFNLSEFTPNLEARSSVRKELGVTDDAIVIGLAARFNPQKGHLTFIQAAAFLNNFTNNLNLAKFVLCGDGITWENKKLAKWINDLGLRNNFHLLGSRDDMPRLTAAMDIATSSSSYGEGFPNVLGEAMGCGIPCVATDVGDSAYILGGNGYVVSPNEPKELAQAWLKLIEIGPEGRRNLGSAARIRVKEKFNLPDIVARYTALYQDLVQGRSR